MEKLTINIIKVLLGTLTFCVLFVLPPVYGKYCASKGCCLGRDDDCSSIFPIQGPETLCYCDSFCNRTNTDCCPDFFEFCLGIKPPPLPHRHDAKCCHDDVDYDVGTTLRVNCNTCTCREVLYGFATFHCTQTRCLVREEIIERINDDPEIGWKADEGSMFIGMPRSKGFNQRLGTMKPRPEVMAMSEISSDAATMDIPKHFDAREHWPGLVGDIQDQGDCASSWAVTTSAVASDRFSIQSNGTMNMTLSMQHLVSCNQKGQQGCYGGHLDRAWWFLRKRGVVTGQCYPYKSGMSLDMSMKKGSCYVPGKFAPAICPDPVTYSERYKTSPPYRIAEYPREIQAEIMKNGPVQAAMHVKSDFFLYKSGVYKYTGLTNDTDNVAGDAVGWHSLRILGWGVDKSNPSNHRKYWLCANSWGKHWGEDGLVRISRGDNECEIESFVVGVWAMVDAGMMNGNGNTIGKRRRRRKR
ncbi:uncharacterized peptidase C1-like protein F26E4.3 [Apostichopus japonicus]|uniref:uncharacterized peptidase C1-like protein F26E4.3 n=1 Tax=Stichopus japonicus TaxID=307972 RepID=UPI003AB22FA9